MASERKSAWGDAYKAERESYKPDTFGLRAEKAKRSTLSKDWLKDNPAPVTITPPKPFVPTSSLDRSPEMYLSQQPMGRADALLGGLATGVTLGAGSDALRREMPQYSGTITAGEMLGSLVPFGAAYKGASALTKGIAKPLVKAGVTGGLAGSAVGAGKGILEGEDLGGVAKEAALYGALGAVGDVAIAGLAPLAKRGLEAFRNADTMPTLNNLDLSKPFAYTGPSTPFRGTRSGGMMPETVMPKPTVTKLNPYDMREGLQSELGATPGMTFREQNQQTSELEGMLSRYEQQRESMVNGYADFMRKSEGVAAKEEPDIFLQIRRRGGIKPGTADLSGEFKYDIPASLKNKNGLPLDEMAAELGVEHNELISLMSQGRAGAKDYIKEAEYLLQNEPEYQKLIQRIDSTKSMMGEVSPVAGGSGRGKEYLFQDATPPQMREVRSRSGAQEISPLLTKQPPIIPNKALSQQPKAQVMAENMTQPNKTMADNIEKPPAEYSMEIAPIRTGGDANSFRQRIDRNPAKKPLKQRFTDMAKNLRTQFVDDLAPLERLEKGVTGEVSSAENSLYKQARLFRGSPEKANELVKSRLGPVIESIEKKGYDYKDLGDYALAVHAKDVNDLGMNSGFSYEEIAAVMQKYGTPEMEKARQELVKVSTDLLQDLADSGVIEQSMIKTLREKYPNYMPLFRSFDDDKVEFASGLSKALANVTSPIKRLEGSDRNVIDPLENMVKNVFQSTSAADRNRVAQQLANLAAKDADGAFIRRLPEGENRNRLNTVYVRENGKQVHYEVQPDVYKAIMSLDKESSNFLIKILQKPASVLRAGATLTPEFSFRNPARDVVQAFITSKSGFNPLVDFPSALVDVIKSKFGKETIYNQFLRDNGGFGNIVSMDRNVHQETIKRIINQPVNERVKNILNGKSLIELLRGIADTTESATKLGEYKKAIKKGATREEAAYRARDLMDFGRAGVSVREANKVVAFLNANIQGKSKLIRAIKENPVGVTTRAITSITLPTVGAYMAQKYLANDKQKKYIDDANTWLKDSFWLIPVPGTDQVARIPKPFDLAPIFANLPERLFKYIDQKDPEAFDKFARETFSSYSIPTMLTGLMPFIEGMANYSFFRQGPIIPQREQDVNFPDQYDINTTETAKFVAKGVNKLTGGEGAFKNFGSPRIIDNTIRGMTGGLGTYATGAIDLIAEGTGAVEKKNKPAKKISEQPLARAFLANETGTGKSMNDLYEEKDRLTRNKGSAEGRSTKFTDEAKLKYINGASDRISKINKLMRQIENDKTLTPQAKRDKLDKLNNNRNEIARQTMERVKKMK